MCVLLVSDLCLWWLWWSGSSICGGCRSRFNILTLVLLVTLLTQLDTLRREYLYLKNTIHRCLLFRLVKSKNDFINKGNMVSFEMAGSIILAPSAHPSTHHHPSPSNEGTRGSQRWIQQHIINQSGGRRPPFITPTPAPQATEWTYSLRCIVRTPASCVYWQLHHA